MSRPLPMYRKILLSEEINSSSVEKVINTIMSINHDDDLKESEYKDWVREPIMLFINTNGGNIYDAYALGDIIKTSKTPVYTVALGWCMSSGFLIYLFGHKRLMGEHATLLYHDVASYCGGKTEYISQELCEAKRLTNMMNQIIINTSKVGIKTLEDYINRKAEWYIDIAQALETGLADDFYV